MMDKKNSRKNGDILRSIEQEETFIPTGPIRKDPNAIYIEDNPQKALEKLLTLKANQNYPEKLQYVKHMAELLDLIGHEGIEKLNEITSFVVDERDELKRVFLFQIRPILGVLEKDGEKGYQQIVSVIVPLVSKLMSSNNYEIKEDCGQQFVHIGAALNEKDRGDHLLTIVLGLAHDENDENKRIGFRLLCQMADIFGKELCEQFIGFEFLSMGEDAQAPVRKEAISNLTLIGKIVSPQFFQAKLFPLYLKLCKDLNWNVRKSCIDILKDLSDLFTGEHADIREKDLTEMILLFLKDSNKWVKISAYKHLGPFISTLEGLRVNDRLIENYLHMADSGVNNLAPDNEILYSCAYNFPAVVLTLGPNKWPTLTKLFQTLVKGNEKIRRPIAYSLHEIAKIIGEERAEKDLIGVLEKFLKDPNDEVKYGAIQNLAHFFKVFKINKREDMVDIFLELQRDQKKWRIRELIARQIDKLTVIFPPETIFRIIVPISFKLCSDTVAIVRDEAARKIHAVLNSVLHSEEIYKISVIENIKGFSQDKKFTNRQSFVAMCEKLLKNEELFKEHFMEFFLPLADDKVPNVRIALAKVLQKTYKKKRTICSDPRLIQIVQKLRKDPSKDVKAYINKIEIPGEEIAQEKQAEAPIKQAEEIKEPIKQEAEVEKQPEVKTEEVKEEVKEEAKEETQATNDEENQAPKTVENTEASADAISEEEKKPAEEEVSNESQSGQPKVEEIQPAGNQEDANARPEQEENTENQENSSKPISEEVPQGEQGEVSS